uniref:Uncharacterized protein n=1 Tax=Ciona intestinalis TaxID=7719 RepID=H2XKF2_CIOIN
MIIRLINRTSLHLFKGSEPQPLFIRVAEKS